MSARSNSVEQRLEDTVTAAHELGEAYRGDWNDFDGRTLRSELDALAKVADGDWTLEEYRAQCALCPNGDGHWVQYCSGYGCMS